MAGGLSDGGEADVGGGDVPSAGAIAGGDEAAKGVVAAVVYDEGAHREDESLVESAGGGDGAFF